MTMCRTAAGSEGMISSHDLKTLNMRSWASSVIFKSNKALSSNANISQDNDLNEKGIMNEASILNDHHESHYPIDTIGGRHISFFIEDNDVVALTLFFLKRTAKSLSLKRVVMQVQPKLGMDSA